MISITPTQLLNRRKPKPDNNEVICKRCKKPKTRYPKDSRICTDCKSMDRWRQRNRKQGTLTIIE